MTPFDQLIWNDPSASVVSDLYPGKAVRFRLGLTDAEGTFIVSSYDKTSIYVLRSLSGLANGVLLGADGALPEVEDTAVESITWGRIKASFR